MNSDFLEKVVSNIFTNLLHTENHQLTTAKVQAIAETSVHYAFILKDTYDRLAFEKLVQSMDLKDKEEIVHEEMPQNLIKENLVLKVETKKQESSPIEDVEEDVEDGAKYVPTDTIYVEEEFEEVEDLQVKKPKVKPAGKVVITAPEVPAKRPRGRQKGWSPKNKTTV